MSESKFKPGDKFTHKDWPSTFENPGVVLTEGWDDGDNIWYLMRTKYAQPCSISETHIYPVPRVVFTEAHIEVVEYVLKQGLHIANWPIEEIMNTLRRDHGEKPKGEAQ